MTATITAFIGALTCIAILTGCGLNIGPKSDRRDSERIDMTNITAISVNGEDGNVTISSSSGANGSVEFVERKSRYFAGTGHCHYSQRIEGQTLLVEIHKDRNAGCEVETTIAAPADATLDVRLDNGDVRISGFKNTVNVAGDNGDITATLESPGGDAPVCNGTFSSDNGAIDVDVRYQPVSGNLSLSTDNGAAKVGLPAGTLYSLDAHVDNGSVKKDLGETAGASFKVFMKSDNGSLKIYQN